MKHDEVQNGLPMTKRTYIKGLAIAAAALIALAIVDAVFLDGYTIPGTLIWAVIIVGPIALVVWVVRFAIRRWRLRSQTRGV